MKTQRSIISILLLAIVITLIPNGITGQNIARKGINYQAVARYQDGNPITNRSIVVEISIVNGLNSNELIYKELHTLKTSNLGLFTLIIGEGINTLQGTATDYSSIDWTLGEYYIQVGLNFGQGLLDMGQIKLQTVPFALVAEKALSAPTPQMNLEDLKNINVGSVSVDQTLKWDGNNWAVADRLKLEDLVILNNLTVTNKIITDSLKTNEVIATTLTATNLKLSSGIKVNEISDDATMASNSALILPTQKAVKSYVDLRQETDPIWSNASANYYTKENLNTSGSSQVHFSNITNSPTTLSGYGITDAMSTLHVTNSITSGDIFNWTTAYNWGSHAGLYRPISYVPDWTEITGKPILSAVSFSGDYNDLTNRPTGVSTDWNFITNNPFAISSPINGQLLKYNDITNKWENFTPNYLISYTETDPAWTASSPNYYTKTNMQTIGDAQLHFNNISNKPSTLLGYGITDAMTTSHPANGITTTDISNWTSAFNWGNHNGLYKSILYVPAWSEITDNPLSIQSPVNDQLLKYNSTSGKWENWTPGYLTSYTETDPTFTNWNKSTGISITASQVTDFNSSVTNNAAVLANTAKNSYPAADATKLAGIAAGAEVNVNADWSASSGDAQILNKPTTISGYGITDAMATSHAANGITTTDISNWTSAYNWGNHTGLYRPISYVPAWTEITGRPSFANIATSGSYTDLTNSPFSITTPSNDQMLKYNSTTGKWENFTATYLTSYTETDPAYTSWDKSTGISITATQVTDFSSSVTNNAAVLANTAKNSYPAADAAKLAGIATGAEVNVNADWNASSGDAQILNKPTTLSGYGITDAMTTSHVASGITLTDISNWTSAYNWGNHTGLYRPIGYVPAWTEITGRPSFSAIATSGNYSDLANTPFSITTPSNNQLLKYNSTSGKWENWTPGYLTNYTETDPTFTSWNKSTGISITASQVTDFSSSVTNNAAVLANTAKNSYPVADATKLAGIASGAEVNVNADWNASSGDAQILNKPTTLSGYGITDAMATSHAASVITSTDISNWTSAYNWGNHTGLYRPLSYVPAWTEITGRPSFATIATSGSYADLTNSPFSITTPSNNQMLKYNSTSGKWENFTATYLTSYTETDPQWNSVSSNYFTKTELETSGQSQINFNNLTNTPTTLSGYGITDGDQSNTNELNTSFTLTDNNLNLVDAGGSQSVDLSKYMDDKDEQSLSINGSQITISNGNTIDIGSVTGGLSFNIDRPITRPGLGSATGQNLGQGKTMSEFFEAFFFPAVAATPPTTTFTTAQTVFPYSVWKNWSNYASNINYSWSVTNQSKLDATDDKDIASIKLLEGSNTLATATPDNSGTTQNGVFNSIEFKNTSGSPTSDFSKTYTLEVKDAQPNTVNKNLTLTMSKAIQLGYSKPTLSPATTVYEHSNTNIDITLNWNINIGDENITDIKIDGISSGSTVASGSKSVSFKSIANGGTQSQSYAFQVIGNVYGNGAVINSNTITWENRLYRGVITSSTSPCDESFDFTDNQVKALSTSQLGGTWKNTTGYNFTCDAGGQYIVFAYPDDAVQPVVQYYDSNFNSWLTYSNVKVIDRANFVNQNGYNGTNYKLVFVCVEYKNVTVKLRLQPN